MIINAVAASIAGSKHQKYDLPNQDAYGQLSVGQDHIMVLADGAGSAKLAQVASPIAVYTSLQVN
jgi:serine/threonine protein phosphatase PrpC